MVFEPPPIGSGIDAKVGPLPTNSPRLPEAAPPQIAGAPGRVAATGPIRDKLSGANAAALTGRFAAVQKSAVSLDRAMAKDLETHLPGVKLKGAWAPSQLQAVKGAIRALPGQTLSRLHGVTFQLDQRSLNRRQRSPLVRVETAKRQITVHESIFELPKVNDVPIASREIVAGLGQLLGESDHWRSDFAQPDSDAVGATALTQPIAPDASGTAAAKPRQPDQPAGLPSLGARPFSRVTGSQPQTSQLPPLAGPGFPTPARENRSQLPVKPATDGDQNPALATDPLPLSRRVATPSPGGRSLGNQNANSVKRDGSTVSQSLPTQPNVKRETGRPEHRAASAFASGKPLPQHARPGTGPVEAQRFDAVLRKQSLSEATRHTIQPGLIGRAGTEPLPGATPAPVPGVRGTHASPMQATNTSRDGAVASLVDTDAAPGQREAAIEQGQQFAESLKLFVFDPAVLLVRNAAQFLLLNTEMRHYPPEAVKQMAVEAHVDLARTVTDMQLLGYIGQEQVARVSAYHGVRADESLLSARDQTELSKNASLERLIERLSLDIGIRGTATRQTLAQAQLVSERYHQAVAELTVVQDPAKFGMRAPSGVFRWVENRLRQAGWLPDAPVASHLQRWRAEFGRLPLAAQLRVDPQLALGASWFRLSNFERELLKTEAGAQRVITAALQRVDQTGYIPQSLTKNEQHNLGVQTLLDHLFDPGTQGDAFRASLLQGSQVGASARSGLQGALVGLRARNGVDVSKLLGADFLKSFGTEAGNSALREFFAAPEWQAALRLLQKNAIGAEALTLALLTHASVSAGTTTTLDAFLAGIRQVIRQAETHWRQSVSSPLELALTEINRQVQEGNDAFVIELMGPMDEDDALGALLGEWLVSTLSPGERALLKDRSYRLYLVEHARSRQTTGASLAIDARQFHNETGAIQQSLQLLFSLEPGFRQAFAKDARQALEQANVWLNLPDAIKLMLETGELHAQRQRLSEAVEDVLAPLRIRQQASRQKLENLSRAVRHVNAGNFEPLLETLERPASEVGRLVKSRLASYLSDDDGHLAYDGTSVF